MEAPQVLRTSILLLFLAFCACWWAQINRFDFVLVQRVSNGPKGFKASNAMEFNILPAELTAPAVPDGPEKDQHYQGQLPPPRNF